MTNLNGKVAIVTGAGKNIGKQIALQLAAAGSDVACLYGSDKGAAEETCQLIADGGGTKAVAIQLDLRTVDGVSDVVSQVESELGVPDILVNNAAIRPRLPISEVTESSWDDVLAINLKAPFFLSQAVIPGMRAKGWGRIVNVSGLDAYWGNPQRPHVVASKLGLIGLSRALANETGRWGITVNTLVAGTIDTERQVPEWYPDLEELYADRTESIPLARLGTVSDLAHGCLFLVSKEASYVTGQELRMTGGAYPLVRQLTNEYD